MVDAAKTTTQKTIAVGAVLVLAAGGLWLWNHDKVVTCALGSAGVVAIVEGVTHGDAAAKILASAAVPVACGAVVETLISEPAVDVQLEVEVPTGAITQTVSGSAIVQPAPPPSSTDVGRLLQCIISFGESDFLVEMCRQGVVDPR